MQLFRKHLHTLANLAMPIGGKLTLMRIGRLERSDKQLEQIEQKVEELTAAIANARQEVISIENDENALFEITYISRASESVIKNPQSALDGISEKAITYNHLNGIGGFLVYIDGHYFQRIEGPKNRIRHLIANILLDPRHTELNVISSGYLSDKSFRRWNSTLCQLLTGDEASVKTVRDLIKLSSNKMNSVESLALLNTILDKFWDEASEG
ncbi:BLUF domain-containing protein [Alteromonas sp. ASW11-36]|uniref:BLUF domain-containing protein n=1 Tax=Alteromonas arenosi TaxID=3055817 RepID=A0ABT7T284_9ALTE|nr:BLUF domain-containing protein [Alteromonas sp. ASW11-36]MDM7861902.1 BLUF domain-containing protein [Alteromonas sp. ASW11-36]